MLQMVERHLPDMSSPLVSHLRHSRLGLCEIPLALKNLASRACGTGLENGRCSAMPICKVSTSITTIAPDSDLTWVQYRVEQCCARNGCYTMSRIPHARPPA